MGISDAISTCFSKYATFQGRATRPEYWYWFLFVVVVSVLIQVVGLQILHSGGTGGALSGLFSLVTFLPGLAVSIRRLHDTNRSGRWIFIAFVPIIGPFVLLYFMVLAGTQGPNQFGDGLAATW